MIDLNFDSLPQAVGRMAERLERIEDLLNEKPPSIIDTSKKKYSLPGAAEYCQMAESTFRTYVYRRKVAGTKFGKAWLFLEMDLNKFISDHRQPTADELKTKAFEKLTSSKKGGQK